jgi:hypothetical protein
MLTILQVLAILTQLDLLLSTSALQRVDKYGSQGVSFGRETTRQRSHLGDL